MSPAVSGEAAVQATDARGADMAADSVQPLLAVIPAGGDFSSDTLVWDVKFSNACIPALGFANPEEPPAECGQDWHVLIDAQSGEFIDAFSEEP